jgi:hypothetical protein
VETPSAENVVLKVTKEETVEFPEKDESVGEVLLTFIGPPANAYLENKVRIWSTTIAKVYLPGYA